MRKKEEEPLYVNRQPNKGKEVVKNQPLTRKPQVPFPQHFWKYANNAKYGKFLQMLKQLHIDMLFVDVLGEMSQYTKFLKDFLSNKNKLEESVTVMLGAEYSAILHKKIPKNSKIRGVSPFLATSVRTISIKL
nr:DNA damage-inducible protein 1-like [Ipomoea batatas]